MQKKYFISFLTAFVILFAVNCGEAFVPQTSHLLYLVVKKIRVPRGLTVSQTRTIAAVPQTGEDAVQNAKISLVETLSYLFPNRLRSDINTGAVNRFYILSGERFVKVINGQVSDLEKSVGEFYTDPLLYRDYDRLAKVLANAGVNVEKVTLQRLDKNICWFIGEPAYGGEATPGLWIGKDSFFPVRYLIQRSGRTIDVRYDDWYRVSKSWYPRVTRIFVDGELFANIHVDRMVLTPGLSASLFDVGGILDRYPRKRDADTQNGHSIETLDTEIDTFNKLYD